MSGWARFWAVDLHVHTPASQDVNEGLYGTADAADVVSAAVSAGLDAIAITDHNTSEWCDAVGAAAAETDLVVLPGVEISTNEGHLLAIWEQGTKSKVIDEVLVKLGIGGAEQGKLDIAANVGFADAARVVSEADGIAIAAHIDRPRGLLKLQVAAHVKSILLEECLAAVEIVDFATVKTLEQKLGDKRLAACVRGSDMTPDGGSYHCLGAIGHRRTWIKAAVPDLVGIRHALQDPELRIRLKEPPEATHPRIESVEITGGFLDRQKVLFSPDLSCLLGGTGAGKSLVLEAIRYVLCQEVDASSFPKIAQEVDSRMRNTLSDSSVVRLTIRSGGQQYRLERAVDQRASMVYQEVDGDWIEVSDDPQLLMPVSAFSQGEVLEASREPVGRMSLIDAGLDLTTFNDGEEELRGKLQENAKQIVRQRKKIESLRQAASREGDLAERVRELSALFDTELVKQQEGWKSEASTLKALFEWLPVPSDIDVDLEAEPVRGDVESNSDLFQEVASILAELSTRVGRNVTQIRKAIETAIGGLKDVDRRWKERNVEFVAALDQKLSELGDGTSLITLRTQLGTFQEQLVDARRKKTELSGQAEPRLKELQETREQLLGKLQAIRDERRQLRRDRVAALNKKMSGIVKLDVSQHPDSSSFREALDVLKTGSRVREDVLSAIATSIHPFRFVRCLLAGDTGALVDDGKGVDAASIARLFANIDDRNLWLQLLEAQSCSMPDQLSIKFKRPEDGHYVPVEQLAHGQKCTAVLVVLLADGTSPVIVDQPEDALHAPWIEAYLVERLRSLRGDRQYIFATRSPGIVVGADAEQIVTMKASAGRGEIEATGSLERHDLNKLTLYHLEGGPRAFRRRSEKLQVSVEAD